MVSAAYLDSVASAIMVLVGWMEALERRRAHARVTVRADAAVWREGDHPRAEDGKFGSGGGSAKAANENGPRGEAKAAGGGHARRPPSAPWSAR